MSLILFISLFCAQPVGEDPIAQAFGGKYTRQDFTIASDEEADQVRGGLVNQSFDPVMSITGGKWTSKSAGILTREEADRIRGGYGNGPFEKAGLSPTDGRRLTPAEADRVRSSGRNPYWERQRSMMNQSFLRQLNR